MLDPEKTRDRELLLNRIRELDEQIAADQRELWELEKKRVARLPLDEQLAFYVKHAVEAVSPDLAGKFRITCKQRK